MDLIPVSADYDAVSDGVRKFAAQRLYELIEGIRPFVAEALSDPGGLWDTEPGRVQAHAALIKLQLNMIKDLGSLYQVTRRPPDDSEEMIPASQVQQLLDDAEARMAAAVEAAQEAAAVAAMAAVEQRERLSLEAARGQVQAALEGLQGRV